MSRDLEKRWFIYVRKVSSQISLCSPHRIIKSDTFRLGWIFSLEETTSKQKIMYKWKVMQTH